MNDNKQKAFYNLGKAESLLSAMGDLLQIAAYIPSKMVEVKLMVRQIKELVVSADDFLNEATVCDGSVPKANVL